MKLLIRHLESVCELAGHDLVLLPSAIVLSRAAFEASVRARWMLRRLTRMSERLRWVLHLRSATEHCSKLERSAHTPKRHCGDLRPPGGRAKKSFVTFVGFE
jgi:hypothetical protein